MKLIVEGELANVKLNYNTITRDKVSKQLVNKRTSKTFKLEYDKRMMLEEEGGIVDTRPWGY